MKMPFLARTSEHGEQKGGVDVVSGVVATWNGGVRW